MPDAAPPFRPRELTPVERALGSIAAQMSHGRRRMNRLSIEHALFVAAGAALTAFAVLVALAFRLSPAGFAAATWALLAGVVTIALGCARRFHAAWVPSAHAALVIDGRAGLQERLATLCAAGPDGRRSRLWTFLLHENLRLLPTWEPRRLVPRFIPRSVWFFAFALLLAALTAGRIPSSARSAPSPGEAGRDASDQTPPPAGEEGGAESDAEEGVTSSSTFWTDLPQALQRAILGSGSSQQFAGRIPERTSPVHDDRGGPAIVGRRMKNAGPSRSAPASPEAMGLAGAGQADRGTLPAPNANRPSESATSPNPRPAQGDRPKALAADPGRSRPQGSAPRAEQAKGAGGGGGGPGAGGGGDREGLFGERQSTDKASGSFALALDALRGVRPDQDGEDAEPVSRPPTVLSTDPRLDDAVRRAQIPAEYEKIVQRIFNRTVDAAERP